MINILIWIGFFAMVGYLAAGAIGALIGIGILVVGFLFMLLVYLLAAKIIINSIR